MRRLFAALALAVLLSPAVAVAASAEPAGLEVTPHGVVVSSSLPSCTIENGSSGPLPCTWNIGPGYTPSDGLQYWVGTEGGAHYVWNRSPLIGHADRYWAPLPRSTCWLNIAGSGRCPNGHAISSGFVSR